MTEQTAAACLDAALAGIPEGQLWEEHYSCLDAAPVQTHTEPLEHGHGRTVSWTVLNGVTVTFQSLRTSQVACRHEASGNVLEISYCRAGRAGWELDNGQTVYLGPGDVFLHTRALCAGSMLTLPRDCYQGLTVCIDQNAFIPPALLEGTGITGAALAEKFCGGGGFTVLPGEDAAPFLTFFFQTDETLRRAYLTVKTLELLLYLQGTALPRRDAAAGYQTTQTETIRAVHAYLLEHIDQRVTIDGLARRFLMNPTTLKAVFKAVYGNSLAAHIKEHRMERAAFLLAHTSSSIADVARAVGYTSPSRFSAAFRETHQLLPLDYRKRCVAASDAQRSIPADSGAVDFPDPCAKP